LFGKLRTKSHTPIFKNIELQLWKQECFEKTIKDYSTSESIKVVSEKKTETNYINSLNKKNFSDTRVSTPLIKQVRGYLSSNSLKYSHVPSKEPAPLEPKPQPNQGRVFGSCMGFNEGNINAELYQQYGAYPMNYSKAYVPVYVPILMHPLIYQMPIKTNDIYTGKIKFFDSTQNYGFFTLDCDGSDLFVHYEDFLKAGICKEQIQVSKAISTRFSFQRVAYYGRYNLSNKAIDIKMLTESY
jgi:hypothetical protein